jgi:predicted regulator of Ras-like GTPase activity (Roadblock/LC7/MglB family)
MGKSRSERVKDKFQMAVEYLTEYSGVKGAVVADTEGVVIATSGQASFDAESFAAYSIAMKAAVEGPLGRIANPKLEHLSVKTGNEWITIAQSSQAFLIVAADRRADDLLSVRISRALEMISSHFKERYQLIIPRDRAGKLAKKLEEVHV